MSEDQLKDQQEQKLKKITSIDPGADTVADAPLNGSSGNGDSPEQDQKSSKTGKRRADSLRCQVFGEYRIKEEVARGAMGIVYRAEQVRLGREVALKVLLTGEHASDGEVRRFTREAQALARLRHPNIVPIYDIGVVNGRHYFTMDYVDGQTLSQVLAERRLTYTESLNIIEQVADAVAAAHTRGVIHRDIKPSNIMIDADGGVHIMDFGLAKSSGTDSKHTRDGTTIGTPGYMPPEQARGEISRVDERSDSYSMGAVLYEMLTGRAPFGGTNMLEVVLAVINEDPLRPRKVDSRLPRELETIIVKAMEKDPARRYRTAVELRDEVRRYQSGEPIRAEPPSFLYRTRKLLRKHWVAAVVPVAVLVIAAAAGAYILYYRQQVQTGLTEGSKAKWGPVLTCDFSPASLADNWETARTSYLDSYMIPVLARQRNVVHKGHELVTSKISYGSSRATLKFQIKEPLERRAVSLGFYGDRIGGTGSLETSVTIMFRVSAERLELVLSTTPDSATARPTVVADRWIQPLQPGRVYRAVAERDGIMLRFRLEELPASGVVRGLATLSYANPQVSNYRFRNMRAVVRGDAEVLVPEQLVMERLFLPRRGSSLSGADVMFYRGDYNGAFAEYQAILNPAPGEGAPPTVEERAGALYQMGLYSEVKNQADEALNYYEQARKSLDKPVAGSVGESVRAKALLREIAVAGRSGHPEQVFKLLPELDSLPAGELSGPWIWDLAGRAGVDLAVKQRQGPLAADLVRRLSYPRGSAVLGNSLGMIGRNLAAEYRKDLNPFLARWLDQVKPVSEPLFAWIRLSAEARDIDSCVELFRNGRDRLGAGNREMVFYAQEACRTFVKARKYSAAGRIISAAGAKGLKKAYLEAQVAANANWGARNQALELLRFASVHWPEDDQVAAQAVGLANTFLKRGRYGLLKDVDEAYHTMRLADAYARAASALRSPEVPARRALDLLDDARVRFGLGQIELARAAVDIGADYAECRNEGDYKLVFEAYLAYPSKFHADNFLVALDRLLARPRFDRAGEVFAFARTKMGREQQLDEAVCAMLNSAPSGEDLLAFMDEVARIDPMFAGKPKALAIWRLELARYHLLAGNELVAAEVYKRVWDAKSKSPGALADEALLRHGILRALGDNRGDSVQARKLLGKLSERDADKTRPVFVARAILNKALDVEAFRIDSKRYKLHTAEVELALAANASLRSDHNAKANHLRLALTAMTQGAGRFAWPYEIIKFKNEDALRSHG